MDQPTAAQLEAKIEAGIASDYLNRLNTDMSTNFVPKRFWQETEEELLQALKEAGD